MQTTLNLLTRDGAFYVAFSPHLTAQQYAELLAIAESTTTHRELALRLPAWAKTNKLLISLDEASDPAPVE